MAAVTVFVDDVVRGRLPHVCAKDGVPTDARLRRAVEVGRPVHVGVMLLLLLLGPVGWVVLVVLAVSDRGERLTVELPLGAAARARRRAANQLRLAGFGGAATGVLFLLAFATHRNAVHQLVIVLVLGALAATLVGQWRIYQESVGVRLDASRRWVTLSGVHPAFAASCEVPALTNS